MVLRGESIWNNVAPDVSITTNRDNKIETHMARISLVFTLISINRSFKSSVVRHQNTREVREKLRKIYEFLSQVYRITNNSNAEN